MKRLKHLQISGASILLGLVLGSCAPGGGGDLGARRQTFDAAMLKGRRVNFSASLPDSVVGLELAGQANTIVSIESDPRTQRPVWVLYNTSLMESLSGDDLDAHASRYLRENESFLGINLDQLSVLGEHLRLSDDLIALNFSRNIGGVLVRDAFIELVFAKDSDGRVRLREVMNRSHGDFEILNKGSAPSGADELSRVLGYAPELLSKRRLIFPKRLTEDQFEFVYATEFEIPAQTDSNRYTLTVQDGSDLLLEGFSNHFNAAPLTAKVYQNTYLDGKTTDFPLAFAQLRYEGVQQVASADGLFTLDQPKAVQIALTSPRVTAISNNATAPTLVAASLGAAAVSVTGATPAETQAMNSYTGIHRINNYTRQFLKDAEAPVLAENLTMRYNYTDPNVQGPQACNAYFNPTPGSFGLYFFPAGTTQGLTCPSMAEIGSVMYHEWGHVLDYRVGRVKNQINDGAFSEGIGDILAGFYSKSPVLAAGFIKDNPRGIRNLDNPKVYPGSLTNPPEVHADGEIIGGTFWELRRELVTRYGETKGSYRASWLFLRHLLDTDSYLESYASVLRLNDDDLNPATKSPDYCLINKVFAKRGLATAENCTDAPSPANDPPIGADLAIAVQSESADGVVLMAASDKQYVLAICQGERYACTLGAKPTDLSFKVEGTANGKVFYVADKAIKLSELGPLTIVAKSEDGKVVSARTIRAAIK